MIILLLVDSSGLLPYAYQFLGTQGSRLESKIHGPEDLGPFSLQPQILDLSCVYQLKPYYAISIANWNQDKQCQGGTLGLQMQLLSNCLDTVQVVAYLEMIVTLRSSFGFGGLSNSASKPDTWNVSGWCAQSLNPEPGPQAIGSFGFRVVWGLGLRV